MMTIVKHLVIAMMSSVFTFLVGCLVLVMLDMGRDKTPPVPISDMLAEAAAGRVEQITVTGTRYEYRVRGATKVAYGPKTTAAELAPLAGSAKIDVK